MWIFLNDAYLSIVSKDCARDEVMVRARRKGDIEKIFPGAEVSRYTKSDYLYRAPIKREAVKAAMAGEVDRVTYANFKDSVDDTPLHNAYLRVWSEMARLQEVRPYSGGTGFDFGEHFSTVDSRLSDSVKKQIARIAKKKNAAGKKAGGSK